jgi:hypothetical protein
MAQHSPPRVFMARRVGGAQRGVLAATWLLALLACGGATQDPTAQAEEDVDLGAATPRDMGLSEQRVQALSISTMGSKKRPALNVLGQFGPPFAWPIVPVHTVLLPDGRVLSYGNQMPELDAPLLNYSVWDPAMGTGPDAMQLLANATETDLFCAGQALLPGGDVLIVGGDRAYNGQRNFANPDVNRFFPATNALERQAAAMALRRWYATVVTDQRGDAVVLGGRDDRAGPSGIDGPATDDTFSATPEVYQSGVGWRMLSSATSDPAYGANASNWYYPRAWVAPDGRINVVTVNGALYALDVLGNAGAGALSRIPGTLPVGSARLPSVMYSPGKVLSVRNDAAAWTVDFNGAKPLLQTSGSLSGHRLYANATALADGTVWVNGGSSSGNSLKGAFYASERWDPATGVWTPTAKAAKSRLYHSIAMLMPDATVLTAGGGLPGPVANLNAEIYYPPYLFKADGAHRADRPVIASAPTRLGWQQAFDVTLATQTTVGQVSLVRFGAVTHGFANDQRFLSLPFTQTGTVLSLNSPDSPVVAPPGFYLLFVLDAQAVPSVAKVIRLMG